MLGYQYKNCYLTKLKLHDDQFNKLCIYYNWYTMKY